MELVLAILGIVGSCIPIVWALYKRYFSRKAEQRKRRAKEDKDAHDLLQKKQHQAKTDGQAHRKQDEILKKWNHT